MLCNMFFDKTMSFRFLSLWHGRDGEAPNPSAVPEEVRLTCTQFVRYHKDQCVQDIVHTRRYEEEDLAKVFKTISFYYYIQNLKSLQCICIPPVTLYCK